MENRQKASRLIINVWFSYFSQGFYFSVGYFAFAKTAYCAAFLKNLYNDRINITTTDSAVLY